MQCQKCNMRKSLKSDRFFAAMFCEFFPSLNPGAFVSWFWWAYMPRGGGGR